MHKRATALVLTLTFAIGPASALETFVCADVEGEVSVEYDYQYDDEDQPVRRVQMQIIDDIGISTDPGHPDYSGEYIAQSARQRDLMSVDVDWKDETGNVHRAMRLRLVEVSDGPRLLQTGGLAVDAGGVWSITCKARSGELVEW